MGEGIDNSFGAFIMEDDAEKMAENIIKLYLDYSKLNQMSDSGKKLLRNIFQLKGPKKYY